MKIGPVDIRNHTFARKMRGIDDAEVRAFLDLVADRLEESIREASELRDAIDRANQEIREYRAMEKTLRDSLVSADRVTEERLSLAEREARLIVKNAEVEAEKLLALSRETGARYRADLEDLRRQRTNFLERFRALLSSQTKILEASARDFNALDTEVPAAMPAKAPAPHAPSRSGAQSPAAAHSSGAPLSAAQPPAAHPAAAQTAPVPPPSAQPPAPLAPQPQAAPLPPTLSRPELRGSDISVPFEPVSTRHFEVRPDSRPEARPADPPSGEYPDLAISYLGEEGLFATPPAGEAAFGEGRPD